LGWGFTLFLVATGFAATGFLTGLADTIFVDVVEDFTVDLLGGCSCRLEDGAATIDAAPAAALDRSARAAFFSVARECSGLAAGNPIICKIDENMNRPLVD